MNEPIISIGFPVKLELADSAVYQILIIVFALGIIYLSGQAIKRI